MRVRTAGGTIDAKAAVITVSTNVLRSGDIAFGAGPARELLDPMQEVPCGSYEKVALAFDRSPVDDAGKLFCMVDAGDGGSPLDFQVARPDRAMMIAHMAGSLARDLAREGEAAMVDFALERLAAAFGADIRKRVVKAPVTGWQRHPFVRGGYSYAKPGSAQRRHAMIAADSGNVAFAGEAFSTRWQATAHGAYQSGRDRAAALVDALGLASRGPRDGRA